MAGDRLLAVVEGLSLKGFHKYKYVWKPIKGEKLLLEVEKQKIWGSYPVGALRERDKATVTVGHAGIEYHSHIRRLILLGCHCTAIVQNPESVRFKPIPDGGEEIMCDYRAEGPDNQATRQILLQLLHELRKPELQHIYKTKMKVKIKERWFSGNELEEELKPSLLPSDKRMPDELDDDPETRALYENAMENGVEIDRTIRVMLIGCFAQGKTTLARRLMGEPIENTQSTDGIDIHMCKSNEYNASNCWRRQNNTEDDADKRIASAILSLSSQNPINTSTTNSLENESRGSESDEKTSDEGAMESTDDETGEESSASDISKIVKSSQCNIPKASSTSKRKHTESAESGHTDESGNNLRSKKRHKQISESYEKVKTKLKQPQDLEVKERNISIWDFGGQYIYYATHQLFHHKTAVYLLVFNLSCPLDKKIVDEDYPGKENHKTMRDYIMFWMNSIHFFVGSPDGKEPRVILVGTHRDQLKNDEEAEQYFEKVKDLFAGNTIRFHIYKRHFMLSLTDPTDENIKELKDAIKEIGGRPEAQQKVSLKWIYLEKALQEHKSKYIISFEDLQEIDKDSIFPTGSLNNLKLFLNYYHSRGIYFYFDENELENYVVVNPEYIIDAFRSVIKAKRFCQTKPELVPFWKELSEKAILKKQLLQEVWKEKLPRCNERIITLLLQKHRIIAEVMQYEKKDEGYLKPLDFYIVPSLLTYSDKGKIKKFLREKERTEISLIYEFEYLGVVETVFHRTLAAAIGTWAVVYFGPTLMVFDNAGVFELDSDHAGVLRRNENEIELLVVSFVLKTGVILGKGDYFRRFVEFVIKNEFRKLKNEQLHSQMFKTSSIKGRCFYKSHKDDGSKQLFTIDMKDMKNENLDKMVCCPDRFSHSLQLRNVKNDWFDEAVLAEHFPKRELTPKQRHMIAQAIVCDWEKLGLKLGLRNSQIQHITMEHQNTNMRIYYMLRQWHNQYPEKATLDVLVESLLKMPRNAVEWDIVKNLKDKLF